MDEASNPVEVNVLGAQAVEFLADAFADTVEEKTGDG
jgi:hypothetical protein